MLGPRGDDLCQKFEEKLVDHHTYMAGLNDLNECCAFVFATSSADPLLVVNQNGSECWINKDGEVLGMHPTHAGRLSFRLSDGLQMANRDQLTSWAVHCS